MIVTSFIGGLGLVFYALGWLLLPDDSDGSILLEEMIAGRWDWQYIGVGICLLLAVGTMFSGSLFIFGLGWGLNLTALLVASLLFYLLVERGVNLMTTNHVPNAGASGAQAYAQTAYAAAGPQPQSQPQPQAAQPCPQPASPQSHPISTASGAPSMPVPPSSAGASGAGRTSQGPAASAQQQPYVSGYQQRVPAGGYAAAMPPTAQPGPQQPFPQQPPVQQTPAQQPGTPNGYVRPRKPQVIRKRRKPAGPIVVLIAVGLMFVGAAVSAMIGESWEPMGALRGWTLALALCCCILGAIMLVLGCMGRRTGGLHPFVWIAMITSFVLTVTCWGFSYVNAYTNGVNGVLDMQMKAYASRTVEGDEHWVVDQAGLRKLEHGINFKGQGYDKSSINVDLTKLKGTKHTVTLNNGKEATSTCPTGALKMAASKVQVVVTVPQGCATKFTQLGAVEDDYEVVVDSIGGAHIEAAYAMNGTVTVVSNEGFDTLAMQVPGLSVHWGTPDGGTGWTVGSDAYTQALCTGITTDSAEKVHIDSTVANKSMAKDVRQGIMWPCAVEADQASSSPELTIAVAALSHASVAVQIDGYPRSSVPNAGMIGIQGAHDDDDDDDEDEEFDFDIEDEDE
ncbi:hypothetical protein BIFGAL_03745 [Bifidobacterium gallicum DSM 20093 = LMG 11596]|nr:hypothetical protein BIFGAL_03745 [Bifidobacterium gallicum DSM 20093 = LMG 11596]